MHIPRTCNSRLSDSSKKPLDQDADNTSPFSYLPHSIALLASKNGWRFKGLPSLSAMKTIP